MPHNQFTAKSGPTHGRVVIGKPGASDAANLPKLNDICRMEQISEIKRLPGMPDSDFIIYLESLERVLQRSIDKRIKSRTRVVGDKVIFKPTITEYETETLQKIQFTLSKFY